jgi:hypothetical protein
VRVAGVLGNISAPNAVLIVSSEVDLRLGAGSTVSSATSGVTLVSTGPTGDRAKNFINLGGTITVGAGQEFHIYSYKKELTILGTLSPLIEVEDHGINYPFPPTPGGDAVVYFI